ncbi:MULTISPECIES: hypothetical protein [Roseateles]|uniref:Uncharacterized protein n=1 Tax=Roseateles albus TaxID=2987525 RepID=A0ABT5KF28_9BURK|nr:MULTISPECIES: hypothetical protein [Roseateles]MCV2360298.1 hypothetical protein [Paucibacter sp. TC2R-5]MDC8771992.1 hypothetical protein [Roseateles albus]
MNDEQFFAPPAFKPDEALQQLKRALRDSRSLSERNNQFSLQGQVVLELSVADSILHARLAKRPARSPDWDLRDCKNSSEARALQDEIKRRLARWTDETP